MRPVANSKQAGSSKVAPRLRAVQRVPALSCLVAACGSDRISSSAVSFLNWQRHSRLNVQLSVFSFLPVAVGALRNGSDSAQICPKSLQNSTSSHSSASSRIMFKFYSADGPTVEQEEADIERYRARHRRFCRNQQPETTPSAQVEDLDVDEGRTRKISAKWRLQQQQQQQIPVNNQFGDGSEMPINFNAFDFSASPEAFYETEKPLESKAAAPSCQDNQLEQQEGEHDTAGKNGRLWERRFSGFGLPGVPGPTKQLPTLGQDALWGGPMHYTTQDAQRRALYYQPQYFA
ncbi:hypothetical protein V7S43_002859 [Phytophthora oleae]|uniref:Uncharacterized protein n=1 Tax=Phytophthora oleae TaxID=2107226 RepID=A0ABD3FZ53_9STRA